MRTTPRARQGSPPSRCGDAKAWVAAGKRLRGPQGRRGRAGSATGQRRVCVQRPARGKARLHRAVVMRRRGWRPGRGFEDPRGEEGVREVLRDNGGYAYNAPREARLASIALW